MLASIVIVAVGFITAVLLTGVYQRWALHRSIVDSPGHRSSHTIDTVRGAGIVFVLVYVLMVMELLLAGDFSVPWYFLAPVVVGIIGLLDDVYSLGVRARFLTYALVLAVVVLSVEGSIAPMAEYEKLYWPLLGLSLLVGLWFVNLYNFMDGINGIAAMQALFLLSAVLLLSSPTAIQPLMLVTLGAVAGFMPWNFPVARVFMGDAGSTMLGCLFFCVGCYYYTSNVLELVTLVILPAVFVVDATVTLLRRMLTGQRWTVAHRSHAYQRLARLWGSHATVVALVCAVNLLWVGPLAWAAQNWDGMAIWALLGAYLPLIILAIMLGAGKEETVAGR